MAAPALIDLARAAKRQLARVRRARLRLTPFPPPPAGPVRLFVGPTNSAGQGWAWARAAEQHLPGVGAVDFAVRRSSFAFPDDYGVDVGEYSYPRWQKAQENYVVGQFSHVLVEAMRPIFGSRHGRDAAGDLDVLRRAGLSTALVSHGSEVRLPSRHAEREPWSPFRERDDFTERLEHQAARNGAFIDAFDGPAFVSTPDVLRDLPSATWLPVVVDVDRWAASNPVMERRRPVVVHAPSRGRLKGTQAIDDAMASLGDLIDYRRIEGIPAERMPSLVRDADIVVDQVVLGLYGVAACEAMAAGRVTVGYLGGYLRDRVRESSGLEVPVVEAGPDTVAETVRSLLADRDAAREGAARGPEFVRRLHDGRLSAAVLGGWLGRHRDPSEIDESGRRRGSSDG